MKYNLTKEEYSILKKLNTPKKIQDFLNTLKINFEEKGDTCLSPRKVLREKKAHCMEGALVACVALMLNNQKPLLVDLTATNDDEDHILVVFQKDKKWGAITKTNHAVLRYREPIYNSIRELVMSFFHEYFKDNGKKTLRSYSNPVNVKRFGTEWVTSEEDLWEIPSYLAEVKHHQILTRKQIAGLRKADKIEIEAGKLVEWRKPKKKN